MRPARLDELERLWPSLHAHKLFETIDEARAFYGGGPWRVRVDSEGDVAIVERWRDHLDALAIRALWVPRERQDACFADLASIARVHGFGELLSPLLSEGALESYLACGFVELERLVACQTTPEHVPPAALPEGITLRLATPSDFDEIAALDAECFGPFWAYGKGELEREGARSRMQVAEGDSRLIGYTLCSSGRGAATLGRVAVAPRARRLGLGAALIADAAAWSARGGAYTIALCTQESNRASRSLYSALGFEEIAERYAIAAMKVRGA